MKITEFIKDKVYLLIFYVILMLFISSVVYFDSTLKINGESIFYVNCVSFVLFILYLMWEYFRLRSYYKIVKSIIEDNEENIATLLPEPHNYEQKLCKSLIEKIYYEQNNKLDMFYRGKKENIDYMDSWVHEIKTPISVSRLIIENSISKTKEEVLNDLEDEISSIENYVDQALYYSRIDSFSKDYLINEVYMGDLINEIIKKQAKVFINKKIKIEISNLDFSINSDKKWLSFIIDQILSNSLKYTSNNGLIKIIGDKNEKEKNVIIEDNGIGIKTEDISRVFHRGFTGSNGRQKYKSTGMGLYLAKSLAEKLGHSIEVQSKYGEFTRVIIHFPKLVDYYNVAK